MVCLEDAAVLGVHLVGILLLRGVELKDIAGLARIAAQLLSGEHDLLCGFIKSRVFQGDLLCFFQRDEICSVDFRCGGLFLLFLQNDAQHRINAVCPLCFCIGKDEPVVRRFDAAAHKGFLGKADFILASGIIQSDFLRFGKSDKFPGVNNAAALCVDLVEILIRPGVELQQVAGLALIAAQLLSGEHDLLRQLIKLRVLQCNLLCFLQGDELRYTDRRNAGDLLEFKKLVQRHAGDLVRGQPGFICCGKDTVGAAKGDMEFLGDLCCFGVFRQFGVENQCADGIGLLQGLLDLRRERCL